MASPSSLGPSLPRRRLPSLDPMLSTRAILNVSSTACPTVAAVDCVRALLRHATSSVRSDDILRAGPCTDRIIKTIKETYATKGSGVCPSEVNTAESCFKASSFLGFAPTSVRNISINSATLPSGCFLESSNGTVSITFNSYRKGGTPTCGPKANSPIKLSGTASQYVTFSVALDLSKAINEQVTLTLAGPADVWFGVGLGAEVMKDAPNAIIVDGNGTVYEQKLADQSPGTLMPLSIKVASNTVTSNIRTVVVTRGLKGMTSGHYSFDPTKSSVSIINAIGRGKHLQYHQARGALVVNLLAVDAPTCVCSSGIEGYISSDMNPSPARFSKGCAGEPTSDLVALHNPTCTIDQYAGGLRCCTSGNILLDKHQNPWEDNKLVYYMKFRFWYQDFVPATASKPASHQNLVRFFHETEVGAGEYDVVKAPPGTAPEDTIYTITAHFQLKSAVQECNPRTSPHCSGDMTAGLNMVYMSCHCHAPACISCELYNADTGELLCSQIPTYGKSPTASAENPYDEQGYIAVPPCLFGNSSEGLVSVSCPLSDGHSACRPRDGTYLGIWGASSLPSLVDSSGTSPCPLCLSIPPFL